MPLSRLAIDFINRYQGGFPLAAACPFATMADSLGAAEDELLETVRALVADGLLSRFGPIFDASRLGGGQTLAALAVADGDFDRVTAIVNAFPAVAHNYRREHRLNMWFVVAAPDPGDVASTLAGIQEQTGLEVYNFPKLHEFYLGLWLELDSDSRVDTVPVPGGRHGGQGQILDALDYRLLKATQTGLPLVHDPLAQLAADLVLQRSDVAARLQAMVDSGAVRRIGAVPNHYRLGLRGNGMTVWDVPDEMAIELGERVGALDFVSHSYLRPRYAGIWPYNLFAMVHGRDRNEVLDKASELGVLLGSHCRAHDVLFSSQILKKTGLRLAA